MLFANQRFHTPIFVTCDNWQIVKYQLCKENFLFYDCSLRNIWPQFPVLLFSFLVGGSFQGVMN